MSNKNLNQQITLPSGRLGFIIESKKHGTHIAIINRKDAKRVLAYRWSLQKGGKTFYAVRRGVGKLVLLHRFLLGLTDPKIEVDHKNHNGLDCRRSNLKKVTHTQNCWNSLTRKGNGLGLKGVRKLKSGWGAHLNINYKRIYLGVHPTPEKAHAAYVKACKQHYGEFGNTKS